MERGNMEEKTYPIYKFYALWDQTDFEHNSSSYLKMFKENPTEEMLEEEFATHKDLLIKKYIEKETPIIEWRKSGYDFVGNDYWMPSWFYHMTYNQFENDVDILKSFDKFVRSKEELNEENGHWDNERSEYSDKPYYCLMGAEDRWRWQICNCEHCKKNGWTTINH